MSSRRDELATLRRGLQGSERLMTLTGPGGIGKSWVARLAVEDVGRTFSDGSYVVGLGDLAGAGLLTRTIAAGLGFPVGGRDVEVSALVTLLGARHVLLVLDRCEHLLPECAELVAGLLRGCPQLRVLATSRQPLGVTGERVVTVPPLAVPGGHSTVDPATALRHDAVALFVERAAAVLPGFRLTRDNVEAVTAVCRRLDGNPLAIELAAARAGVLAPQAILDRLDDRYRLLTKGSRGAAIHLRSLRASVEASWDLCTPPERRLWARLAVFPADFELDAVEEACSGDGIEPADVLDLVDSLLDKSVLVREADPVAVRYRMHETLRAFGAEQLGEEGLRRWSDHHLEWVERLVRDAGEQWFGPRQNHLLRRLRREHATVGAALVKATADAARAPQALRMILALEPWWVTEGRVREARYWLAAALDHGTGTPVERPRAYALAAWFATIQGDLEEAESLLDEGSASLDDLSPPRSLSAVARARGGLSVARRELEAAEASFDEAVQLAVRAGHRARAAEGWLLLGLTRRLAGRPDEAGQALRRCVALADRAGDSHLRASALALQALEALGRDEVSSALALARQALAVKVEAGDRFAVAFVLEVMAWVALAAGDAVRTAILLGAAERMLSALGVPSSALGPLAAGRDERLAAARAALGRREFDRNVARGAGLSWEVALRYAVDDLLPRQRRPQTSAPLTSRELAVAELVARGLTNREIAAALVISVRTVQGHVEHILRKLGFGSRAQVAAWVAQRGVETGA